MANVVKILHGSVLFGDTDNSKNIALPESLVSGTAFPIIHARNELDSTFIGSAGNVMFRPINLVGNSFDIVREYSFQQAITVDWQIVIFDSPIVSSSEITVAAYNNPVSDLISLFDFSRCYLSGSTGWTSNAGEVTAAHIGDAIETEAPNGVTVTTYGVDINGDISGNYENILLNGDLVQTGDLIADTGAVHFFSSQQIYGTETTVVDGRDLYTIDYDTVTERATLRSRNASASGKMRARCKGFADSGANWSIQQVATTVVGGSKTVTFSQAVPLGRTLFFFGGAMHSYGRVDTFEEEFGDFGLSFDPSVTGGNVTGGTILRGERGSQPDADAVLIALTFTGVAFDSDLRSILRGVFNGVGKGVF